MVEQPEASALATAPAPAEEAPVHPPAQAEGGIQQPKAKGGLLSALKWRVTSGLGSPPSEVKQHEVITSGSSELPVELKGGVRRKAFNRLIKRAEKVIEARGGRDTDQPRSQLDTPVDNYVVQNLTRWKEGKKLTRNDLAVLHHLLNDEILNKTAAIGIIARDSPGRLHNLRRNPIVHGLSQMSQTQLEAITSRFITDYTEELGTATSDSERMLDDIVNLCQLRLQVEEAYFPPSGGIVERLGDRLRGYRGPLHDYGGFRSNLWDQIETGILPTSFIKKTGNVFHDRIVEKFIGREGRLDGTLTREFPGMSPQEVWRRHPDRYLANLEQANQEALADSSPEIGKAILESRKVGPKDDMFFRISAHIKKYEAKPKLPDGEKMVEESEITSLEAKISELRTKIGEKNSELFKVDEEPNQVQQSIDEANAQAIELNNHILHFRGLLGALPAPVIPAGATAEQIKAITDAHTAKVAEYTKHITDLGVKRSTQLGLVAKHTRHLAHLNSAPGTDLRNRQRTQITTVRGELEAQLTTAITDLPNKKAQREKQQKILTGEKTPEQGRVRYSLEKWQDIGLSQQGDILMKVHDSFTHREYSMENLTSTRIVDGRVEGAEYLRQLILNTFNEKTTSENVEKLLYDPQNQRDLLDEYFIARTIIDLLHIQVPINVNVPLTTIPGFVRAGGSLSVGMEAIDQRIREIKAVIPSLDLTDPLNRLTNIGLQSELDNISNSVLTQVLPHMRRSHYTTGELVQNIIRKKLESCAAKGDPFAFIPYERPDVIHRFDPEAVLTAGLGEINMRYEGINHDMVVRWEGEARNTFTGNTLPIHARVELHVEPDNNRRWYGFRVRADQQLVSALQGIGVGVVPPEIRRALYRGTVLDVTRANNQWITIVNPVAPRIRTIRNPSNLNVRPAINMFIGPGARINTLMNINDIFPSVMAVQLIEMEPEKRLELFRGLPETTVNIPGVGPRRIRMDDDGELWFYDPGNPDDFQDLESAIVRDIRNAMGGANLDRLDPIQMENTNRILRQQILTQLGTSVYQALSGRS